MQRYRVRIRVLQNGRIIAVVRDTTASRFKLADLLPWTAIFISIISLGFTVLMGIFSREHDRLSVLPYLHMNRFGETDPTFGISVQNDGVGPAVIEKVQIWYNNRILTSLPELYRQLLSNIPKMTNGRLTYTEVILGEYYRTGQTVHLMEGNGVDSEIQKAIWDQISSKLEIKINYCSTYKDCSVECLIASKIDCEKLSFNLPGLRLP